MMKLSSDRFMMVLSARFRCWIQWRRRQKTFGGVENPRFDEFGFSRFAAQLRQRSREVHPIEDFLMAARFDRGCGIVSPRVVVARATPRTACDRRACPDRGSDSFR